MKLSSYQNLRLPNFSVHGLCAVLKDADLDWQTALTNAEIDPDAIDRPGGTIPAKKELAFQLQFVALTKDRVELWVKAAQAYTLGVLRDSRIGPRYRTDHCCVGGGRQLNRLCTRPDGNFASPDFGRLHNRHGIHLSRHPRGAGPVQRLPGFLRHCQNFHVDVRQPPFRLPTSSSHSRKLPPLKLLPWSPATSTADLMHYGFGGPPQQPRHTSSPPSVTPSNTKHGSKRITRFLTISGQPATGPTPS